MAIPFEKIARLISFDDFVFRIGELSKMTEVSPRQLRYWEQREYIKSLDRTDDKRARLYDYHTYVAVRLIKYYLDEGHTLESAVTRMRETIADMTTVRKFIQNGISDIQVKSGQTIIDLGEFNHDTHEHLYAHTDGEQVDYEVK